MKSNEESKLIKNNKSKNQENKKFFCSFLKNTKSNIIKWSILIILLALIIFTIISIIILFQIKKEPMKILLEQIQQNKEYFSLPANESTKYSDLLLDEKKICSTNKKFAILRRTNCEPCGLFSYYIVHLGCIINYLKHGYIPILEVLRFRIFLLEIINLRIILGKNSLINLADIL